MGADTSCVAEAVYTVEATVAVGMFPFGVLPFCAKMSPEAATAPRIISAATIMTTKRI